MMITAAWVLYVAAGTFPTAEACEKAKTDFPIAEMVRWECTDLGGPAPITAPLPARKPEG